MGSLAAEFYRHPSEHLLSIGVTGTNGKTSSTQWIAQLLTYAGRRCAVIGTVGIGFADEPLNEASLTTPDSVSLQREVRALLDAGARALAMEVSSIGLAARSHERHEGGRRAVHESDARPSRLSRHDAAI